MWGLLQVIAGLACLAGFGMIFVAISGAWQNYGESRDPNRWGRRAPAYERLGTDPFIAMNCQSRRSAGLDMLLIVPKKDASSRHRDFTVENVAFDAEVRVERFKLVGVEGNVVQARRYKPWSTWELDDEAETVQLLGDASEVRRWATTGELPEKPSDQSRKRLWEFVDQIRSAEAHRIHRLGVEAPVTAAKVTAAMLVGIFVLNSMFDLTGGGA